VGTSLCNFLHINATLHRDPHSHGYAARVLLQFGSRDHLRSDASTCATPADTEAAAHAGGAFEWPRLAGVSLLGWHLPVEGLAVEVVQRADTCGGLIVAQALEARLAVAAAGPQGLLLELSALQHQLECPYGLSLSWRSGGAAAAA
jgi:hypothetical protein